MRKAISIWGMGVLCLSNQCAAGVVNLLCNGFGLLPVGLICFRRVGADAVGSSQKGAGIIIIGKRIFRKRCQISPGRSFQDMDTAGVG